MIRSVIALLGAITCFSAPALAQSFGHTHGAEGFHSHDTTIQVTHGTCCQTVSTCGHASHSGHHGHSSHHSSHHGHSGHTFHDSHSGHVTRTWTRRIEHPTRTTHTWTRTVPGTVVHRGHQTHSSHVTTYPGTITHTGSIHPGHPHQVRAPLHTDRDKPWAHYDHRWKSRTKHGYRSRY